MCCVSVNIYLCKLYIYIRIVYKINMQTEKNNNNNKPYQKKKKNTCVQKYNVIR